MPGNLNELVQMISALSDIQAKKRQLTLGEAQLAENSRQFAVQGEEQNFASALKLIAGSSAKAREGYTQLLGTLSPEHRAAAEAYLSGQPIDPSVTHAQEIATGLQNMDPQQRAILQNEAATQAQTGMNVGQMATSQLGGRLATGAIPLITPEMTSGYAQRASTGQDLVTAAIQQKQLGNPQMMNFMTQVAAGARMTAPQAAQVGVEQAKVNLGYAGLDQNERKMAADYGLDWAKIQASGKKGGLTGSEWLQAVKSLGDLMNDVNKNTSDEASNLVRRRLFNTVNESIGSPLPPIPIAGEGAPGKVGLMMQYFRGLTNTGPGLDGGGIAWPTMAPPTLGAPR